MKIIEIKAKEIFTKTKLGADWVVNPYVGCAHQCLYCYAKFMAKWRPVEYGQWGTWVEAKVNAPELVQKKSVKGEVFMSSICDAYQPVEKELQLTRRVLENMDKNVKLSILTKSDLILRDIDILRKFHKIEVGLTINSFTGKAKDFFEPKVPATAKRLAVLQKLKEQGISTYAFVSPIIPGLIDLPDIINKTKNLVDYYWFEFLNLRGAGKEFAEALKINFLESYKVVSSVAFYQEFIDQTTNLINSFNIKIRGIVKH